MPGCRICSGGQSNFQNLHVEVAAYKLNPNLEAIEAQPQGYTGQIQLCESMHSEKHREGSRRSIHTPGLQCQYPTALSC